MLSEPTHPKTVYMILSRRDRGMCELLHCLRSSVTRAVTLPPKRRLSQSFHHQKLPCILLTNQPSRPAPQSWLSSTWLSSAQSVQYLRARVAARAAAAAAVEALPLPCSCSFPFTGTGPQIASCMQTYKFPFLATTWQLTTTC